jgi:glycosyltransferase involved in cell wall biosynthesis
MPVLSIGMPLYNGETFLEKALSSILAQTFGDFELIVSDNSSTDRSVEIVRAVAARDNRIRLRENATNLGAAVNYNVLVELARGKYFKWAAHDDLLAPTCLERCVAELERRSDAILCYPTTLMIDEADRPTGEDPFDVGAINEETPHDRFHRYMDRAWPKCGCNAVFGVIRMDGLKKTRLIGGYAASDKILLGELALLGKFDQLPDALFLRREHPRSSVRANPDVAARNRWFNTASAKGSRFIRWKWVGEYLKGITHVPIPVGEKLQSYWKLRHHLAKDERRLKAELKLPVKKALAQAGLRKKPPA